MINFHFFLSIKGFNFVSTIYQNIYICKPEILYQYFLIKQYHSIVITFLRYCKIWCSWHESRSEKEIAYKNGRDYQKLISALNLGYWHGWIRKKGGSTTVLFFTKREIRLLVCQNIYIISFLKKNIYFFSNHPGGGNWTLLITILKVKYFPLCYFIQW